MWSTPNYFLLSSLGHPMRFPSGFCCCSTMGSSTWPFADSIQVGWDNLRSFPWMQRYYDIVHFGRVQRRHPVESSPWFSSQLCSNCCECKYWCQSFRHGRRVVYPMWLQAPVRLDSTGNLCVRWCTVANPVWLVHIELCERQALECYDDEYDLFLIHQQKSRESLKWN